MRDRGLFAASLRQIGKNHLVEWVLVGVSRKTCKSRNPIRKESITLTGTRTCASLVLVAVFASAVALRAEATIRADLPCGSVASSPAPSVNGKFLEFSVSEEFQGGRDLNGDGDATDTLNASHNLERSRPSPPRHESSRWRVGKARKGSGWVWYVEDRETGTSTNLGLTAWGPPFTNWQDDGQGFLLAGGGYARWFEEVEEEPFVPLDKGPFLGRNSAAFGVVGVSPLLLRAGQETDEETDARLRAEAEAEAEALLQRGRAILHVHDFETGVTTNLQTSSHSADQIGDWLIYIASERMLGEDLNRDGDVGDGVLQLRNLATGKRTNVGLATSQSFFLGRGWSQSFFLGRGWLVFSVSESQQGALDLNGDGDVDDSVLHIVDLESGRITSLGEAWGYTTPVFSEDWFVFTAMKSRQETAGEPQQPPGGDAADPVLHVHDVRRGLTYNLGLSPRVFYSRIEQACCMWDIPVQYRSSFALVENWLVFPVDAAVYAGRDFNDCAGEGENAPEPGADEIWHVVDLSRLVAPATFLRGDVTGDGVVDVTDPISNLGFQFLGSFEPPCFDACDFDDNGFLEIADPIGNLTHQFLGGPPPAAPGKNACGVDPTKDWLSCESVGACAAGG